MTIGIGTMVGAGSASRVGSAIRSNRVGIGHCGRTRADKVRAKVGSMDLRNAEGLIVRVLSCAFDVLILVARSSDAVSIVLLSMVKLDCWSNCNCSTDDAETLAAV